MCPAYVDGTQPLRTDFIQKTYIDPVQKHLMHLNFSELNNLYKRLANWDDIHQKVFTPEIVAQGIQLSFSDEREGVFAACSLAAIEFLRLMKANFSRELWEAANAAYEKAGVFHCVLGDARQSFDPPLLSLHVRDSNEVSVMLYYSGKEYTGVIVDFWADYFKDLTQNVERRLSENDALKVLGKLHHAAQSENASKTTRSIAEQSFFYSIRQLSGYPQISKFLVQKDIHRKLSLLAKPPKNLWGLPGVLGLEPNRPEGW